MTTRHFSTRRDPDESDTAPAMKPKRDRSRSVKSNRLVGPLENAIRRGVRRLGVVKEERETPLVATRPLGGYRESGSRRDPRGEIMQNFAEPVTSSKRDYNPPGVYHTTQSVSEDGATGGSFQSHGAEITEPKIDPIMSANLSEITSNTYSFQTEADVNTTFSEGIMIGDFSQGALEAIISQSIGSNSDWDVKEKDEDDARTEFTESSEDDLESLGKYISMSSEASEMSHLNEVTESRRKCAFMTIFTITSQLAILLIQLSLCGIASLEINPVFGPYPDAFSEWGGKNAYLMLDEQQYFRLITPAFLHVGVLHFLVNACCALQSVASFEQEWGACGWLTAYIISAVGAVATSCYFDPNDIGVSSSGALMGLFGAKVSQYIAYSCFELHSDKYLDSANSHQMAIVFCNLLVVFLLCFVTYIDLSGHLGGFATGLFVGMVLFCSGIKSACARFLWSFIGLAGLVSGATCLAYYLYVETNADEELGDACQYFRNLYPEDYDCECQWG